MKFYSGVPGIKTLVLFISLFAFQCREAQKSQNLSEVGIEIIELALTGEIASWYAEISSLTWYKDQLIILPQYPDRFLEHNVGSIFKIPKNEIIKYIDNLNPDLKLNPTRIEFDEQGIPEEISGFQGYESVIFIENKIFLTIESIQNGAMQAYLVEGFISADIKKIVLNAASLKELPVPIQLINYAYESMIYSDNKLFIFYEANGANITDTPTMIEVNLDSSGFQIEPFLNIEFRITDATDVDERGCFWVINYFWPGDFRKLNPASDQLASRSKPPINYSENTAIERLVELKYSSDGIQFGESVPIVLGLGSKSESRNWEGIVRLDNRGFILATDKHPRTIIGFLPYQP